MEETPDSFQRTLQEDKPPEDFSVYLKALWYDRKGQWNQAHSLIDHLAGTEAAKVHAYLHRKEGDLSNARYWYRQAGAGMPQLSLDAESEMLIHHFMDEI